MTKFERLALGKLIILAVATAYLGLSDAGKFTTAIFFLWTFLWFIGFVFIEVDDDAQE